MEDIKKEIEALEGGIKESLTKEFSEKLEKSTKEVEELGKVNDQTKAELTALTEKYNEAAEMSRKEVDELHTEMKKIREFKNDSEPKTFKNIIMNKIESKEDELKELFKLGGKKEYELIEQKAVADMTIALAITGATAGIDQMTNIAMLPGRKRYIREFLPVGTTSGNIVYYLRESGAGEGTVAVQTEGAAKAQTDQDFVNSTAQVYDIAHFLVASNQMLEDIPGLSSTIANIGVRKLLFVEDSELLGFGTMTGLTSGATNGSNGYGYTVTNPSFFDSIQAAAGLLYDLNYQPDVCFMRPSDISQAMTQKDSQERPLHPNAYFTPMGDLMFAGLQVVPSTAITADKFLIGQSQGTAEIKQRSGINVRFSDQDSVNFRENNWTIRIEERLALTIGLPLGWAYGDFSDSHTSLST